MTNPNKAELRRLAENAEGSFGQFDPSESEQEFMARITPAAVLSILDELDAKDNTLLALVTRHFAESWIRRSTDAKLDEYLSAGIAQLQEERDAALDELARLRALLLEASEEIAAWGAYASDYFQEKHGLEASVAKFHDAAMSQEAGHD